MIASPKPITAGLVFGCLTLAAASGAFIVEPNGLASANYSAVNATVGSTTAGSPTLAAPGLTFGAASVFSGEPYTYVYTPGVDGNNVSGWSSGTVLNSGAGIFASGVDGGGVGFYNVYHVFPQSTNTTQQPTHYEVLVNGLSLGVTTVMPLQDQNIANLSTGSGVGLWELVAQVAVTDPAHTISLNITPDSTPPSYTGVRTAGVLFDYTGPIPEPSAMVLVGLGWALLGLRRRR